MVALMSVRPPRTLAAGALAAGALAACGGSQLAGSSIEKLVAEDLGGRGYAGAKADCPDVDNEVGTPFTCTLTGVQRYATFEGRVAAGDKIEPVEPDGGYRE